MQSAWYHALASLVIILGIVLTLLGYFIGVGLLELGGIILIVLGVCLFALSAVGHPLGRRYWY